VSDREFVERWLAAFAERRPLAGWRMAWPDLELRLPDGSEHRGRATVARVLGGIMWRSRGTLRMDPVSIDDVGGGRLVARTHNTARRAGERLDLEMEIEYLVRDGRMARIEERVEDMDAWLRFWRPSQRR
jgi:hypothetical protein